MFRARQKSLRICRNIDSHPFRGVIFIVIFTVLFIWKLNDAAEGPYFQKKVALDQKENFIAFPTDFCVLEDECFVICDIKDQKIIVYDQDGRFLTQWKKYGQGPGDYQGIWFVSYQAPCLAVVDLRRPKVLLYERKGRSDFKWVRDIPESGRVITDFLFFKDNLCFDTTVLYNNRFYFIHIIDLDGKKNEYLLPAAVRYGGRPEDNHLDFYEAEFRKIWGLPFAYLDVLDEYVFSSWAGDLKIFKINRNSQEWVTFGEKTENYNPFKLEKSRIVTGKTPKEIFEKKNKEREKYSWVGGLFADRGLVGLLYMSFNQKESKWITFLQLYNLDGKLIRESKLPGVGPIDTSLKYYYQRETGSLYFLSMIDEDDKDVGFEILKFKIRE